MFFPSLEMFFDFLLMKLVLSKISSVLPLREVKQFRQQTEIPTDSPNSIVFRVQISTEVKQGLLKLTFANSSTSIRTNFIQPPVTPLTTVRVSFSTNF